MTVTSDKNLLCLISKALNMPEVEIGLNPKMYRTPGWDSLATLEIIVKVEEEFGISIEDDELEKCTSLSGIKSILGKKGV